MVVSTLAFVLAVFLLAGFAKGVIGLGLPTISMGLLAVVLSPVEAAALLILPSLVTNVWQMVDGSRLRSLVRRLWPLNLGVCIGTWAGAAFLSGLGGPYGALALGIALMAYAASGLAALKLVRAGLVPKAWLGPLAGAVHRGAITAATGVFVIPAVPYLQAIGLTKDELVQALGLSFTVSTLASGGHPGGKRRPWCGVGLAVGGRRGGGAGGHAAGPGRARAPGAPDVPVVVLLPAFWPSGAYLAARGLA
jgi:hypothetical protein